MKRRGLFALLGGAAVVAPVAATAKGDEPMTASELSGLQSRYREAFIRAFDERIPDRFAAVNPGMAAYLAKGRA
jgi:hypothetical protein